MMMVTHEAMETIHTDPHVSNSFVPDSSSALLLLNYQTYRVIVPYPDPFNSPRGKCMGSGEYSTTFLYCYGILAAQYDLAISLSHCTGLAYHKQ